MSRLDSSLHPALTDDAVAKLFSRGIFTALSFVETDPEVIVAITDIQYSMVVVIRNAILTKYSSCLVTGYKLYKEIIDKCAIISTGIKGLDNLLDGGFMTGNIYELCGSVGSGKTQICMTVAANICNTLREQTVLYIDTKNDVSGSRILEIVENRVSNIENAGDLMNRIKICRVSRATELLSLLHKLTKDFQVEGTTLGFRLIIIDSLPCPFFRFLGADGNERQVLLNNLAALLHFIASEYHVAVLITNLVTNWTADHANDEEDERVVEQRQTPALGKYWAHIPETRIAVKKIENAHDRLLVIVKSTSQPSGKTANVSLTKSGAV